MSMNLMFETAALTDELHAANWAAIKAAAGAAEGHEHAEHGMVMISDDTITSIARLLSGQRLSNGELISAYYFDEADEWAPSPMVCAFGPSLLPVQEQDYIRDRLAADENGARAVRLFNEVLRLGLQISFQGTEHCPGHMKGVNWTADEVEFSRCSGNMYAMLEDLGLSFDRSANNGEVAFDVFAKAVNDNGWRTDCADRLKAFVACAARQQAQSVCWA